MSEFQLAFDLHNQFLGKESFAENDELTSVGPDWSLVCADKFNAPIVLDVQEWALNNIFADGLEGRGSFMEGHGDFLGGFTGGELKVEVSARVVQLEQILDGGGGSLLKDLLDSGASVDGLDGILLSNESQSEKTDVFLGLVL